MQGRFHYYEGHPMTAVTMPVRVMHHLGVRTLIITNAAGSLCDRIKAGSLAVINDHINLMGTNPLIGFHEDWMGIRFPDMTEAYDRDLIRRVHQTELKDVDICDAVYAAIPGPSLPTAAELNMLRICGTDIVGMSTVPEVLVARQLNMRILAISVITDQSLPGKMAKASPQQVRQAAMRTMPALKKLIQNVLSQG